MPRLRYIEESEKTPHTHELIESAKRTGAPDPRVVSLMTRSPLGIAWVEYWNKLLYQGVLPHKLKEAALHYADLFKQGEHAIDKDQVYADLAKQLVSLKARSR
jgi:hypothetical protein